MRMRKKKNSESRMNACSAVKVENPKELKGKWDEVYGKGREMYLEIGCGKGTFVTELAKRNPDKFYIAMEVVPDVIMLAMEKAVRENVDNVMFVCFDAKELCEVFCDSELSGLYLNFSDPWPKTRHHKRRLTYISFLEMYKKVIKDGGNIYFKTDNRPLFDFSLLQFNDAKIPLCQVCTDLHTSMWEKGNIHTEYEDNFSAKGFTINRLVGRIIK